MKGRRTTGIICLLAILVLILGVSPVLGRGSGGDGASGDGIAVAQAAAPSQEINPNAGKQRVTQADRTAAAANAIAEGRDVTAGNPLGIGPGDQPDYFGMPNYANSPLPEVITTAASPIFYFAEGTCRPNFDAYFTIQNPGNLDADVAITYMTGDGRNVADSLTVKKNARATVIPRNKLGTGDDDAHDFSAKIQCINGQSILVERPTYFNFKGMWNGGHNVVGATALDNVYYFSEGTTRPNFETYYTILNGAGAGANVKLTYYRGDGTTKEQTLQIPARTRATVHPADTIGAGDGVQYDFSTKVECTNGEKIVAERPMYFNYNNAWNGGHNVMGTTAPDQVFYFAEGTNRPNYDPFFSIVNLGGSAAKVKLTYMKDDGTIKTQNIQIAKNARGTVRPADVLGSADIAHDFSTKVESLNGQGIVAERSIYFNYNNAWTDGHVVVGSTLPGPDYYFAEGTCRPNFDPYITIQNPGATDADVTITYMKGNATTATQAVKVLANSRSTVSPRDILGTGDDAAHDFSASVACTNGQDIVVERPMYFDYMPSGSGVPLWTGGHNAMGATIVGPKSEVVPGTGIRKFVNGLPGLGAASANDLGQFIPVAEADTTMYPGEDYYEIELGEYTEQMHSDLPATTLRGYRQTNATDPAVNTFHYLGPTIVAQKDKPVRVKFTNSLPTGAGGDLFLPTDTTLMGAGMGPIPGENYTQNRAAVHLHGGNTPWISDGTPHQWTVPDGEATVYPKGVSIQNVPDMWFRADGSIIPNTTGQTTPPEPGATNDPGDGSITFYFTNQQSSRLLFYHDHAYGITRLNVYAGEAAPYIIRDDTEQALIDGGVIPTDEIPLVIQDRTFVPDDAQLNVQDPTWDKAKWGGKGNFWLPHVYMPNQNPADPGGMNAFARWHYGPWFWPPTTNITFPPIPNAYAAQPGQNPTIPATPNPSSVMESFMDTSVVNGTAYPVLEVDPKSYRLRILNAADDRFYNLQLYTAKSQAQMWKPDGTLNNASAGEVKMVPAALTPGYPELWPTDGRDGGVPDPATMGPDWIQIGNEGGFLPAPAVMSQQPITWNLDPTTFNFGVLKDHTVLLGPAERADVVIDFSQYAGKTLILYNDCPAPVPALDPRYDYYTYNPDLTATGGAPPTQPGYGPNTRTIMQIKVAAKTPAPAFNLAQLQAAFASTATTQGVFEESQDPIIFPTAEYDSAYNKSFPVDPYFGIDATQATFNTVYSGTALTIPFEPKAIQDEMGEAYDNEYGRMSGFLGLEVPTTSSANQNFVQYPLASPPVDLLMESVTPGVEPAAGDGTQIWKIVHNGVDTHPIHFHKYDVQVINRVGWDNAVLQVDPNELGWKETVRVNPLEAIYVAMRPVVPSLPFPVPNSVRMIDPTKPVGDPLSAPPPTQQWFDPNGTITAGPAGPGVLTNEVVNYGWEFVVHCHILSHEEMDMMHGMPIVLKPPAPSGLVDAGGTPNLILNWTDNSINETNFVLEWALDPVLGPWTEVLVPMGTGIGSTIVYNDNSGWAGTRYYRVKARNMVGNDQVNFPNFPFVNADSLYTDPPLAVTRP